MNYLLCNSSYVLNYFCACFENMQSYNFLYGNIKQIHKNVSKGVLRSVGFHLNLRIIRIFCLLYIFSVTVEKSLIIIVR